MPRLYVRTYLAYIGAAFRTNQYQARNILTMVKTKKTTGMLRVGDPNSDLLRVGDAYVAPGGLPVLYEPPAGSDLNFTVKKRKEAAVIPDEDRDQADEPMKADIASTEDLVLRMLLRLELEFRAKVLTIGNKASVADGDKWDTTGNAVQQVKDKKEEIAAVTGRTPNALLLGSHILDRMTESADFRSRHQANTSVLDIQRIGPAAVFGALTGIDPANIFVADGWKNNGNPGEDPDLERIWANDALLFTLDKDRPKTSTFASLVRYVGGGEYPDGVRVRTGRADERDADYIDATLFESVNITNAGAGYLFQDVVSDEAPSV